MNEDIIIVTGAAGFVGSNLVDYLLEHTQYDIIGIDNLTSGFESNLPTNNKRFKFVEGSCALIKVLVGTYKPKAVFHLAAKISVSDSFLDPQAYTSVNCLESMAVMTYCMEEGIPMIFSSSNAVYGGGTAVSIHSPMPISPYAVTKRFIEQMGIMLSEKHKFPFVGLRYTNVFGQRQRSSGAYGNIFSAWMTKIKDKEYKLPVYGTGHQTRDYVYVKDVCQANLKALEYGGYGIFDVGSGVSLSVNDVFSLFKSQYPEVEKVLLPARSGDVEHTKAFMLDKTVEELNYQPTDFKEAISETMQWYNKNFMDIK